MAKPSTKSIQQLIYEQKLRIAELEDELLTQKYFETMPVYGPTYAYSYATSNMSINGLEQHVDNWIKAVVKHMGTRSYGHGGEKTNAILISIPEFMTEQDMERWLSYTTEKIRKKAQPKKRNKGKLENGQHS
jgi:hypothetical protein